MKKFSTFVLCMVFTVSLFSCGGGGSSGGSTRGGNSGSGQKSYGMLQDSDTYYYNPNNGDENSVAIHDIGASFNLNYVYVTGSGNTKFYFMQQNSYNVWDGDYELFSSAITWSSADPAITFDDPNANPVTVYYNPSFGQYESAKQAKITVTTSSRSWYFMMYMSREY